MLGIDFFISHTCNFSKDPESGNYTMSILNGNHTILLEFNTLPPSTSINVAQTMVTKKETIIDTDKNNVSNVDSIPLQDQIIPNPLLKKIFGTTKKAIENITAFCNVLQTKKHKIDNKKNQQ